MVLGEEWGGDSGGHTHKVLWVLTWGRRRRPRVRQRSHMRSALRRTVAWSRVSAGVGNCSRGAPSHLLLWNGGGRGGEPALHPPCIPPKKTCTPPDSSCNSLPHPAPALDPSCTHPRGRGGGRCGSWVGTGDQWAEPPTGPGTEGWFGWGHNPRGSLPLNQMLGLGHLGLGYWEQGQVGLGYWGTGEWDIWDWESWVTWERDSGNGDT